MTSPISSNINTVQLFNATNAFKNSKVKKPEEQQPEELLEEAISTPSEAGGMFANHDVDEIKNIAQSVGEDNLSNDDIKYGLFYGRSVIVDYAV